MQDSHQRYKYLLSSLVWYFGYNLKIDTGRTQISRQIDKEIDNDDAQGYGIDTRYVSGKEWRWHTSIGVCIDAIIWGFKEYAKRAKRN